MLPAPLIPLTLPGLVGESDEKTECGGMELGGVGVRELEVYMLGVGELPGLSVELGFIRSSFWRLLQNQTLTTSFSIQRPSAM